MGEVTGPVTAAQLSCPRCGVPLAAEIVGALGLHRCGACGGVWLDPETFRAACEGGARPRARASGEDIADDAARSRQHDRVTYLRCPVCDEVMNRVNFARVSGVVLDVCRPHGAWFDAGELRAVRSFVRGSGLRRFARLRELDAERERLGRTPSSVAGDGIDVVDVLAGIPDRFDVPSTRSAARWFLRAAVLAAGGFGSLWKAFHASGWRLRAGAAMAVLGCVLLLAALRALDRGLEARKRERGGG